MRRRLIAGAATGVLLLAAGCGGSAKPIGEALKGARTADDVAEIFGKYKSAGDDAIKSAFCNGITTYNQEGALPDGRSWFEFLLGEAQESAVGVSTDTLQDKADELATTLDLAQVNGRAAQMYAKGCLLRP